MNADHGYAATAPDYPHLGAHRRVASGRCWPLPSDTDEAQLALSAGDGVAGDEAALAGAVRARRRPCRIERRARLVLPPCTLEPDAPLRAFDELRAASLACAEPGGPGHRGGYERIAAVLSPELSAASGD